VPGYRSEGALLPGSVESATPEWLDQLVTDRVLGFVEGEAASDAIVARRHDRVRAALEASLRRLQLSAVPFVSGLVARVRLVMRGARQPLLGTTTGSTKSG
jgi:hypothetical protein